MTIFSSKCNFFSFISQIQFNAIFQALKTENKQADIVFDGDVNIPTITDVNVGDNILRNVIKSEIKEEKLEDNDSMLDNYDVDFEEYESDLVKNLVKEEGNFMVTIQDSYCFSCITYSPYFKLMLSQIPRQNAS